MKIAGFVDNDMVDGKGICVSLWLQGCPHHCKNCHNPETWSFNGGLEYNYQELFDKIDEALNANGIERNFSLLGGEPLCLQNVKKSNMIGSYVRAKYPNRKIFLWTGYTIEELFDKGEPYTSFLGWANVIVDGPYIDNLRDVTLDLRGSSNQRVINILHQDDKILLVNDTTGEVIKIVTSN